MDRLLRHMMLGCTRVHTIVLVNRELRMLWHAPARRFWTLQLEWNV